MNGPLRAMLSRSMETGFLDACIGSSGEFRPHLVLNDPPRSKVLTSLLKELDSCTSFEFSVAFITTGGLGMLLQGLLNAQQRGVKGKVLTSDYLNFTDPDAIEHLMTEFPNIEVRVYTEKAFHAKGYLFHHEDQGYSSLVLGSSNITHGALATNREWNVQLVSLAQGELLQKTQEEFRLAWTESIVISPAWLDQYRKIHESFRGDSGFLPILAGEPIPESENREREIHPNDMQKEALQALDELRLHGKKKALLISATGTGKTFLAAFDVEVQRPKRFLFVVHRQQIALEAMRSFRHILGEDICCGFLGGGSSDVGVQYLFSMIQTLSQDEVLYSFPPDYFDYIVVDEVHRGGASSYRKVISYFTPNFLLGMTATPERTDGFDIYGLFDHTIAYEIRLQQALEADLLCPFHYFGISALTMGEKSYEDLSRFSSLEMHQRIVKIKQMLDRYSIGTYRRRGLIFCSRNEEAKMLASGLCACGLQVLALNGSDSFEARENAFARLEMNEGEGMLEYLVAVDIFNEGVDIPSLNQVIMIRPTQSAIIFVQQLGRGLRKHQEKKFLTVIDFIGNYTNNYMIPIALYGDNSYKKDTLRRLVNGGSLSIKGPSTVSFDTIAKERIYASINAAPFTYIKFLREEYLKIKAKVGRIPTMVDFVRLDAISPLLFIEYAKKRSYYHFKTLIGETDLDPLTALHLQSLGFLSQLIPKGIRPYEGIVLELLLGSAEGFTLDFLKAYVQGLYGFEPDDKSLLASINILQCRFFKADRLKSFGNLAYCETKGTTVLPTKEFLSLLANETYRKELEDVLSLGAFEYRQHYVEGRDGHDLVLYQKYTRQEVCRLLNWKQDDSSTIYGYRVHKESHTCPIFVTYHKKKEIINASTDYPDGFLSRDLFQWVTRNNVKIDGTEPPFIRGENGPMQIFLFVQKSNDEGLAFYYLGNPKFLADKQKTILNDKGKLLPMVEMVFRLPQSVPQDLYAYIIENGEPYAAEAVSDIS